MTQYTKPAVRSAWGQTATSADLQDPGNSYASAGWQIGIKPPRQYENWVINYMFSGIRYLCQQGIPNWDPSETYASAACVVSPEGYVYRAVTNNTGQNPDTTFGTQWDVPYIRTAAPGDSGGRVANTQYVSNNFLPVGTPFDNIAGQIGNNQVPVGAVTQWQGSLSISGTQVGSPVPYANTILINGGYRTIQWSGQSGQPSYVIGSSDGVNFLVWNPANFGVANSQQLTGLSPSIAAAGSSVMVRDSSGYAYTVYFNQSSPNNENPSISQFMVTNGSDNFLRKASNAAVANLLSQLGFLSVNGFPGSAAVNGYQKFDNGIILQWGQTSVSGTATTFFPIAFTSRVFSVVFTNASNTNQIFLNGLPSSNTSFSTTNGTANLSWFAVGF